jgi:hypothetical protein
MAKEQTSSQMETCTQENTKKESLMERVSIPGRMALSISVNSRMDWNMGRESGSLLKVLSVISMKEITARTRSMGMAFSNGQVETDTKVSTKMMNEMAMVRWSG